MSEKLDGVRAFWDGTQFVSRLGNVFHAPAWFVADFPKTPLDGEGLMLRKPDSKYEAGRPKRSRPGRSALRDEGRRSARTRSTAARS